MDVVPEQAAHHCQTPQFAASHWERYHVRLGLLLSNGLGCDERDSGKK
jgi:hypothetical protein